VGTGATPIASLLFPPFGRVIVLLLAQKKGTVEAGTRVSGGCAVPSLLTAPLAVLVELLRRLIYTNDNY